MSLATGALIASVNFLSPASFSLARLIEATERAINVSMDCLVS
jgi:hypothetical protein